MPPAFASRIFSTLFEEIRLAKAISGGATNASTVRSETAPTSTAAHHRLHLSRGAGAAARRTCTAVPSNGPCSAEECPGTYQGGQVAPILDVSR